MPPEYLAEFPWFMLFGWPLTIFCQITTVWRGLAVTVHSMVIVFPYSTVYDGCKILTLGGSARKKIILRVIYFRGYLTVEGILDQQQ